ncbi:MAG: hypothetical protein ABI867_11150 [Kofleriaceae bacterium]
MLAGSLLTVTRGDELAIAFAALGAPTGEQAIVRGLASACGWGDRGALPPTTISHGVPWGLSLVPGSLERRVFVEGDGPAVTRFAADHGAVLDRLVTLPALPLWHAVRFDDRGPRWHVYLRIPPAGDAVAVLARLGVTAPALRPRDRITLVSLDLTREPRIKAYVLMPDAAIAELPADTQGFARAMLGDDRRIWWLVAHGLGAQPTTALHFGVARHVDEATVRARIAALLATLELDATAWQRVTEDHHFVSFQHVAGRPRVTTYFIPRVAR